MGKKTSNVIIYCCYPQFLLVGGNQYVTTSFLSIWKCIVCEKYLRSAITDSKLGTVEDMLIACDLKLSL